MKSFIFIFLLAQSAWAGVYDCNVKENFQSVYKVRITATDDQRLLVRSDYNYYFYLSIYKAGNVELEAFLPGVDMRIYAKGNLEKSSVKLTAWQRDLLLEFECANSSAVYK